MTRYLLIESQSSCESGHVHGFLDLAEALGRESPTDVFLVQNAVLMARSGAEPRLEGLLAQPGISVWVDPFSLESRAIREDALVPRIRRAGVETLVELLARPGCKPLWH